MKYDDMFFDQTEIKLELFSCFRTFIVTFADFGDATAVEMSSINSSRYRRNRLSFAVATSLITQEQLN
jgi:hypothetical protein